MAYTLTNSNPGIITISDNRQDGIIRNDIVMAAGATESISDEQHDNIQPLPSGISAVQDNTDGIEFAIASADASDLATAITLVNEIKALLLSK